ncbi:MAG: superoxide dismutase, Fe-Mn family [Parcubacteria bacterium C7867-005]|nr:MAG: superoxide dismutase, Fe-Mn family [Parcubacteria bacterium C7867-005]
MTTFEEKKFEIPKLIGISEKTIEEHLKLYAGYVKNTNTLLQGTGYDRRFPFEFNGMRNHEVYFAHFVGGPKPMNEGGEFAKMGFDLEKFKELALTRGVGWAMVYYDKATNRLIQSWVDEQHLGQLSGLTPILALDMWEHSYYLDYTPADKKQYVETFFKNLNWETVEDNLAKAK